jgi:hypothetical protein
MSTRHSNFDVIDLNVFEAIWNVHESIVSDVFGYGQNWTDICYYKDRQGKCKSSGVLQFFNFNRTYYNIHVKTRDDLVARLSAPLYPDGTLVLREQVFGNYTVDSATNRITHSQATLQLYQINPYPANVAFAWERCFTDTVDEIVSSETRKTVNYVSIFRDSLRSFEDEASASVEGDMYLLALSYTTVSLAVVLFMQYSMRARPTCFRVFSRFLLSVGGLGLLGLAITAAFGICAGIGMIWVPTHAFLPFVLIAVGVNDMYLLTRAFDAQDHCLPIEERLCGAFRRCGRNIGYTAYTSSWASYVGFTSRFPAMHSYCFYAGTGLLSIYAVMLVLFSICLCWDAEHEKFHMWFTALLAAYWGSKGTADSKTVTRAGNRTQYNAVADESGDTEMVVLSPMYHEGVHKGHYNEADYRKSIVNGTKTEGEEDKTVANSQMDDGSRDDRNPYRFCLEYFFSEVYAPLFAQPSVRVACVAICLSILIANIAGVAKIKQGIENIVLLPGTSFVRDYIDQARTVNLYLPESYSPVYIVFDKLQYHQQDVQQEILRLQDAFLNNTQFNEGPCISWVTAFHKWVKSPASPYKAMVNSAGYLTDAQYFYEAVEYFVNLPQFYGFKTQIVFGNSTGPNAQSPMEILSSRVIAFHSNQRGPTSCVHTMSHARDLMSHSTLDPLPFVFSSNYITTEGYKIAALETSKFLGKFVFVTGEVSFAMLPARELQYRFIAGLSLLATSTTMLDILGNMAYWQAPLEVNFVTEIFLVMSFALIVDYTLHIVHTYVQQPLDVAPNIRLCNTLREIGPGIFTGLLTSLLAIIPIAHGQSYTFRTWFKLFFSVILYSSMAAFLLLPAVLPTAASLLSEEWSIVRYMEMEERRQRFRESYGSYTAEAKRRKSRSAVKNRIARHRRSMAMSAHMLEVRQSCRCIYNLSNMNMVFVALRFFYFCNCCFNTWSNCITVVAACTEC